MATWCPLNQSESDEHSMEWAQFSLYPYQYEYIMLANLEFHQADIHVHVHNVKSFKNLKFLTPKNKADNLLHNTPVSPSGPKVQSNCAWTDQGPTS